MIQSVKRKKKEEMYRLSLFVGELILRNGGETVQVEDACRALCESKGYPHVSIFVSPTAIVIGDDRADGITFMKTIKSRGINLDKVSLVTKYVEKLIEKPVLDVSRAIGVLKRIERREIYENSTMLFFAGFASAAFAVTFGAGFKESIAAFFVVILALVLADKIKSLSETHILATLVSCAFISFSALMLKLIGIIDAPDMVVTGSILSFLPGVAITKSIRDLVSGDLLAETTRAIEAIFIGLAIAAGVGGVMKIWVKFGGTL